MTEKQKELLNEMTEVSQEYGLYNEPIFVNGIDVSGCDYYKNNGKCRIPHYQQGIKYTCCNCNDWDCGYKKLKRKEEDITELSKIIDCKNGTILSFKQQLDQLKTENEHLEEKEKEAKHYLNEAYKYKQALQEIFKCLILANRADKITDTVWIDNSTTLWDYMAQVLGIIGDQLEIEEPVLQDKGYTK